MLPFADFSPQQSYINTGNRFSQILLLQNIAQDGLCVIVPSHPKSYEKIAHFLGIPT